MTIASVIYPYSLSQGTCPHGLSRGTCPRGLLQDSADAQKGSAVF